MLPTLILSLGLAQTADTTTDPYRAEVIRGPGLYDAPHLSPLPEDLPPAEIRDGGVWLPMQLNLALGTYRRACDLLPGVVQVQLDQLELVEAARWAQGLELGAARERVRRAVEALEAPPLAQAGLPSWIRTGLLIVGGVVLVTLGVLAGWGLHGAVGG